MKVSLFGGFGENGRVCIGIESGRTRIIIDAGIKTDGGAGGYTPDFPAGYLAETDGIVITHAHEDHIGAVGFCVSEGFTGTFHMTRETLAEAPATLAAYANPAEVAGFETAPVTPIKVAARFRIGDLEIETGRSGHAVGGVWVAVDDGHTKIVHCGDIVPASPVLAMDPIPRCDVLVVDASYGDDDIAPSIRSRDIRTWVARSGPCVLPTPLIGRSLELLALLEDAPAIHADMRAGLEDQLRAEPWFQRGKAEQLRGILGRCEDWTQKSPWPPSVLLADDGMGLSGPSTAVIPRAVRDGIPLLGTGHLPHGSPLQQLFSSGYASWHRLPTHPTMDENIELVRATRAKLVLAHSCRYSAMPGLAAALPELNKSVVTGDTLTV